MDLLDSSINLLREFEPLVLKADPRGYCVCSSFGKDSVALIKVFMIARVKFWVKWNITGIDPPELVYFAREQIKAIEGGGISVYKQMHEKSMCRMIVEHKTPPSRIIRYCCDELKEKTIPTHKNCFHSYGVRKIESNSRQGRNELELIHKNKNKRISHEYTEPTGQLKFSTSGEMIYLNSDNHESRMLFESCAAKGIKAVNPLVYWNTSFLWDFIRSEKIPYCRLYDEGFSRLGCIGCPVASKKGRKGEFKRWPKFYDYYMRAFEKMLIKRKEDKVDEMRIREGKKAMPWETPQDVMDWWLQEEKDEKQISMLESLSVT